MSLIVCFICLLATLRKNFQTDLHEIFREGWQWANEQLIEFWWRSGSRVSRALAEVCTVPLHFKFGTVLLIILLVIAFLM